MQNPHESVCTSRATKVRIENTLREYREILDKKLMDLKHKVETEKLLNECRMNADATEEFSKLPHSSRQIYNMIWLEKALKEYPEPDQDCHRAAHEKHDEKHDEKPFEFKTGKFNEIRMNEIAKPKQTDLKRTLEDFREFMSLDKQKRIECQLEKTLLSPESLETIMRKPKETKTRNKRDDALKLLRQIEKKISSDIYDEIACKILKKLPKLILCHPRPLFVSENVQKLQKSAFDLIVASNGPPESDEMFELFCNFSNIISNFVVETMADSMDLGKKQSVKCAELLISVEKNRDLLKIANNLIERLSNNSSNK